MAGGRKAELRRCLRAAREGLGARLRAQADATIAEHVLNLPELARADIMLAYRSFGAEVDTDDLISWARSSGMAVALPRCVQAARALRWFEVDDLDGLVAGPFGLYEPDPSRHVELSQEALANPGTVALVPGLAFDERGLRLGYGGGYYDTFLRHFAGVSVGLCREAQLVRDLGALGAIEPHDLPVCIVVSERRVLRPQ